MTDFIALNFKEDLEIFIILGRPFLATSRTTVDVEKGELTMDIDGEVEMFKCVDPSSSFRETLPFLKHGCQAIHLSPCQATNLETFFQVV